MMTRLSSIISIFSLVLSAFVISPVAAFAADANVGNEVVDAADTTLTRSGAGTAANPFKLALNLGNANTWTAAHTFNGVVTLNGALNSNGIVTIGDGGDAASISATTITLTANGAGNDITANVVDNNTDALDIQQGTNNYINVSTVNASENISFGNSSINPGYSFLGNGVATFGGNLVTSGDVAVNGGDVTTTATTGNLFNTSVTTLNVGGSATAVSLGASTGTSTVNNALTATGLITANNGATIASGESFTANGSSTLNPNGTNDVTINTDADSTLTITGLATDNGTAVCIDGSDNIVKCSAAPSSDTLQSAYDGGNLIVTTDARDLGITLADTATDSSFIVRTASGSTGTSQFARGNGSGSADPAQLVLIDNEDVDSVLPIGLKVVSTGGGGVTTAIDVSEASIIDALALGSNNIVGTNFSVSGSNGNITSAGDIVVNGGDVVTTASTATLFNTSATTVNIAGSATTLNMGSSFGSTNINSSTVNFSNATSMNATAATGSFSSLSIGGGYGSTGVSISSGGNFQANGNLTIDGTSTLSGSTAVLGTLSAYGNASFAGASTFSPSSTSDITFNTDADSYIIVNGLSTASGSALCLDGSNIVVLCDGGAAAMSSASPDSSVNETVQRQQQEIDALKQEIEALKAKLQ